MSKYLISVDIEGITGVVSHDYSSEKGVYHAVGCRYMEHDVNAVVVGLRAIEPGCEILVRDAHGAKASNLTLANLNNVSLLQGWEGKQNMFAGLDADTDGILCVGYHAGGDNLHALLSHTLSSKIRFVKINNKIVNEAEIFNYYAKSLKIPLIFISGDDQLVNEAKQRMDKEIVSVAVKKSLSRTCAISLSLQEAAHCLEEGAKEAARKLQAGVFKALSFDLPNVLEMEIGFFDTGVRTSLFAGLRDILDFDKSYFFDWDNLVISLRENNLELLLAKLNLILRLSYTF